MDISEKRAHYPLQEKIKIYSPDTIEQKLNQSKQSSKPITHGINILNKTNVDNQATINRIKKRREIHNLVERRRRDQFNHLMMELSELIPRSPENDEKCNKAKLLKLTIDHIQKIQNENNQLRAQLSGAAINLPELSEDSDTPACLPDIV